MRLAVVVLIAGCGFGPQDSFTGRRAADGIAPWGDVGPIELCLGEHRIAPPGGAPSGTCASASAPADAACETDGDCRSRERCVCGRCAVQRCELAEECGEVQACRDGRCQVPCDGDADCQRFELCLSGVCRQACTLDGECQSGEVCATTEGRCTVDPCEGAADCRAGETCRINREPRATDQPSPLAENDGITLWFELDGDIWRARSADGVRFRLDPQPVLPGARAPSVLPDYTIYVETPDGIARAESTDGVTFAGLETVATGDLHAPAAAEGVLFAASPQGIVDVATGTPVLAPAGVATPLLWRSVDQVGSPFVLVEGDVVRVWFEGHGIESAAAEVDGVPRDPAPNDSIGYAVVTAAGAAVWPFNPVFDRAVAFLEHRAERSPAVARFGEGYLLYYVGARADGSSVEGIRVARNPR